MNPRIGRWLFLTAALVIQPASAQWPEGGVAVIARGSLTTTVSLAVRPDAVTPEELASAETYRGMTGAGLEVRIPIVNGDFFLSLSAEYAQRVVAQQRPYAFPDSFRLVPVEEGIRFLPFEAGLHAVIPVGSEVFRMSMGMGVGAYYAARILRIAGHASSVEGNPVRANLFVTIGFEYRLFPALALEAGVTFRDVETTSDNRFPAGSFSAGGSTGPLPASPLPSRVTVNGMTLTIGLSTDIP